MSDAYAQPTPVNDVLMAFPGVLGKLVPNPSAIPPAFYEDTNEWAVFASDWFYSGWPERGLIRRPGVDADEAYRHLRTILGSYEPKHEHKMAAVAWLTSRWFLAVGPRS